MILLALKRKGNFLWGCLLSLFGKTACENKQVTAFKESEQSKNISPKLHTNFPNIFCTFEFLEILSRNYTQFLNQFENP